MAPIEELGIEQLDVLEKKMQGLKENITNQVHIDIIIQATVGSPSTAENIDSPNLLILLLDYLINIWLLGTILLGKKI